ncbi:MAG: nucleotidyl transferase AbiEii/AbiGii toxin family protein [Gammaproteobacteria bacterium]|nr:nucleotidyl transferase AbiEii/AbiGii toxin family protein [Gammaproteobacteria bacterium]
MNEAYKKQVSLLLDVLPEVAKEVCFAMHGGTAINLFVRDMPRLSVDIDLTYVEIAGRKETLDGINAALVSIKERIEGLRPSIRVQHKANVCKLQLNERGVIIKIEVNMVGRGLISDVTKVQLCKAAQEQFDVFCVMPIVPLAQTYGGKLCAAMDRQHPRDLFDVKLLLENEGFTNEIKRGFIFGLISSSRPTHELLGPHLLDQRVAFKNQFEGMSSIGFSYDDFEATRLKLIETIKASLNSADKAFLLSVNRLTPDWSLYDFENFPSVKWKLLNLEKFKKGKPEAYQQQLAELESLLR